MAHVEWHKHPALHKLSEEWSFCVGDGAKPGFPFVTVSPGFERLTLFSRKQLVGLKCGDVLATDQCNPPWLLVNVREAVTCVASKRTEWADFLVINRRANNTCFPNYVRITMLSSLTGESNDQSMEQMMLGFQFDASDILTEPFHIEWKYADVLSSVRNQLDWPVMLGSSSTRSQLAKFVKLASIEDGSAPPVEQNNNDNSTTTPFSRRWRSESPARSVPESRADTASTRSQTWPGARQPVMKRRVAASDENKEPDGHVPSLLASPDSEPPAAVPSEHSAVDPPVSLLSGRTPSPSLNGAACTAETMSIFAGCQCSYCRPRRAMLSDEVHQPLDTGSVPHSGSVTSAPSDQSPPIEAAPLPLPDADSRDIYVIEYRHTTGAFQPRLLAMAELQQCVEPRHLQGGPVIFIRDPERHAEVMKVATQLFPRHVIVEAALVQLVTAEAEGIKAGRGRKVNQKSRRLLEEA